MDADNLDKIEALLDAASPGPWDGTDDIAGRVYGPRVPGMNGNGLVADCYGEPNANAELIATLRNVAPELLAVVRAMRAIRDGDWWEVRHKDVQRGANALDALDAKLAEVLP